MAIKYADFPIKEENGKYVEDKSIKHSEPVLFPGDTLRWKLVSDKIGRAQLAKLRFKFISIDYFPFASQPNCPCAHDFPTATNPVNIPESSAGTAKETPIRAAAGGKHVFPPNPGNGPCNCEFHRYRGRIRVRDKDSSTYGNIVDPHVIFHGDGGP